MGWQALAHLRWHPFIGLCWHDGIIAAVPPIPTPKMPHITFNVLNGLFLGALPSDSPAGMVQGPGGIPFMGRTNDAGFITPHVSIPPNNFLLPLTILFGSSESMLGSSKVKIQCTNLIFGADEYDISACTIPVIPLSTNFGCNDPLFVPLDMVISPNTVVVEITLVDLLKMLVDLIIAALIEGLMMLGGAALKKVFKKVKAKRSASKLAKASGAGDDAYKAAYKHADDVDVDHAFKEGLRKQRAKATGAPIPPPKPNFKARKEAKKAGDEAFNKEFRKQFPPAKPGPDLGDKVDHVLQIGRIGAALRHTAKEVVSNVIEGALGHAAPGANDILDVKK